MCCYSGCGVVIVGVLLLWVCGVVGGCGVAMGVCVWCCASISVLLCTEQIESDEGLPGRRLQGAVVY